MPNNLTYIHLASDSTPPSLDIQTPFRAVVIIEQPVSQDWQLQISDWLVRSGCLYMMAWGQDCSSWDDSVDLANLKIFDFGDIPDDRFVMTTWHADEPLSEVMWFAKNNAFHPDVELEQTILLHVAANANESHMLRAYGEA